MRKTALITGATSGIGRSVAEILARNGYNLIVTGRREERLKSLRKSLQSLPTDIHCLCFDIRDKEAVHRSIGSLFEKRKAVNVLINNAGLALEKVPVQEGDTDDWDQMIDVNIKGLLYMTKAVLPLMMNTDNGHIVNIGSVAGREVYKGGAVYCATKFAVDALTKGMRIDLLEQGIRVTSICPGNTETEFSLVRFKGDEKRTKAVYEYYEPLRAEDIAEAVWFAVSRPPHVTINDMLIMPTAQANTAHLYLSGREKL